MDDERRRRLAEIHERWWGVHTSHDLNPDGTAGRVVYGAAHRHAGEDIGYLLHTARALLAERDALAAELADAIETHAQVRAALVARLNAATAPAEEGRP